MKYLISNSTDEAESTDWLTMYEAQFLLYILIYEKFNHFPEKDFMKKNSNDEATALKIYIYEQEKKYHFLPSQRNSLIPCVF